MEILRTSVNLEANLKLTLIHIGNRLVIKGVNTETFELFCNVDIWAYRSIGVKEATMQACKFYDAMEEEYNLTRVTQPMSEQEQSDEAHKRGF